MNVNGMIAAMVATQAEQDRPRLKAAMELGARVALEAVLSENAYNSDVKKVLAELDGKVEALTPAAPGAGRRPRLLDRQVEVGP
jgi:hypothetical protein